MIADQAKLLLFVASWAAAWTFIFGLVCLAGALFAANGWVTL